MNDPCTDVSSKVSPYFLVGTGTQKTFFQKIENWTQGIKSVIYSEQKSENRIKKFQKLRKI